MLYHTFSIRLLYSQKCKALLQIVYALSHSPLIVALFCENLQSSAKEQSSIHDNGVQIAFLSLLFKIKKKKILNHFTPAKSERNTVREKLGNAKWAFDFGYHENVFIGLQRKNFHNTIKIKMSSVFGSFYGV